MDTTECDASWNIDWNCTCAGKTGAETVTVVIGGISIQACVIRNPAGDRICMPGAASGTNGGVMTVTWPAVPPETQCQQLSGSILIDGTDAAFCIKDQELVDCPSTQLNG